MTRTALIVGAGIGGLTAGIALRQRGWDVTILEKARALTDVGAGIQISPNGTKVLKALGVLEAVEAHAFEPDAIELRMGQSGRRVFHMAMGQAARDRWHGPHLNVHRADLLKALVARFDGTIETSAAVSGYDPEGLTVNGKHRAADLVLGADGLHSVIRTQMVGPECPRFTGNIAWRCLVPADQVPKVPQFTTIWAGPGKHAITNRVRGGALVNFVGVVETDQQGAEDWDASESSAAALKDFDGWHKAIQQILVNSDKMNRWPLYDRAPLDQWVDGTTALLGDAAHPMLPSMAQGAVQAIEDAWVLAQCLDAADIPQGLQSYQTLRQPRTAKVQALSAKNLQQFHKATALGKAMTYGPMALAGKLAPKVLYSRPDWIYRANPDDWQSWAKGSI